MKKLLVVALASIAFSASAAAQTVEAGYPTGSLAVAAIERGDWTTAERLLNEDRGIAADNPLRLLNLGQVYMATGRPSQAIAAWRQALADPHPAEVTTLGGRTVTTQQLAQEALDHYEQALSTAAR
jgi:tetratricopeptide (TPR) repeat protein